MKLAVKDLNQVINTFIEEEIIPKGSAMQKFITLVAVYQMQPKINSMLSSLVPFSDDGYLDIEFTKNNLVTALEKAGGILSIPVINYNIDKSDILKLFEIAGRYAK